MKRQANINRKPTEAKEYYVGSIRIDGVETRVLFTAAELRRPIERARKQPEDFPQKSGGLGIFEILKKLLPLLLLCVMGLLFTGCASTSKNITNATGDKNVNLSGFANIGRLDTGYNPATGTVTPSGLWIVGSVSYKSTVVSVPEGNKVPDSGDYERTESASIFNSNAKTTTVKFSFTASSKEAASQTLQQLVAHDNQQKEGDKE